MGEQNQQSPLRRAALGGLEIAGRLREIAAYLKLRGDNPYRARAYEAGAASIEALGPGFEAFADAGRLTEVPGLGEALAGVIAELRETGRSERLERLRAELPPGLLALSRLPGLTWPRLRAMHSQLGVTDLAEAKAAIQAGRLRALRGFGPKTEQKILHSLERAEREPPRLRLSEAQELGNRLLAQLRAIDAVEAAALAGAVRRWKETVGTLRLVGASPAPDAAIDRFLQHAPVLRVCERQPGFARVSIAGGATAEVTIVEPARFAAALVRSTASRTHLARLEERAAQRGLDLSHLAAPSEGEVYERLGLPEIPPELREDAGEIEAAERGDRFTDLVQGADIRGAVHCHTVWSDGRHTVEQMAAAAAALGLAYITITDHSATASYAGGLTAERLAAQATEIAEVQRRVGVELLRGTESDILVDGSLDYELPRLRALDVVIASIHNRNAMDEEQMTRRLASAMRQPLVKIWGHGLGRLIMRRDPVACRVEEVLDAAAASGTIVEINGDPNRLDLPPPWIREARRRGLRFVVSVDAHSTRELDNVVYGVAMARRGGVRRHEVLNTLPAAEFRRAVHPVGRQ